MLSSYIFQRQSHRAPKPHKAPEDSSKMKPAGKKAAEIQAYFLSREAETQRNSLPYFQNDTDLRADVGHLIVCVLVLNWNQRRLCNSRRFDDRFSCKCFY